MKNSRLFYWAAGISFPAWLTVGAIASYESFGRLLVLRTVIVAVAISTLYGIFAVFHYWNMNRR